jgi:dethiobiotin synthetase
VTDLPITGTDTGVGETVVAAALVMARRQEGVAAVGFKPLLQLAEAVAAARAGVVLRVSGLPG